jgi:peptide/nickel transport system ATP-binding protein
METILLEVKGLSVAFPVNGEYHKAVDDVSFSIETGKTLGMAGESGCGKSVTSLAIMRLLGGRGKILSGEIRFKGEDLLSKNESEMRRIRGKKIAMIFQEPMSSLNPVFTIGSQLIEKAKIVTRASAKEAEDLVVEMLKKVKIFSPKEIYKSYPHMMSGGMQQRVMIALAMIGKPELLIADEPTTALDVTIQAQILDLMRALQDETGTSILFISHDMGVMAEMADDILLMYAGQSVEYTDIYSMFDRPFHPYARGLIGSIPKTEGGDRERLPSIPGTAPNLSDVPRGCRFYERCSRCDDACKFAALELREILPGHFVRCRKAENRS